MSDKAATNKKANKGKVVVSPSSVKSEGTDRKALELTAPIGLVWNEDKNPKPAGSKPRVMTATGWPDRPPKPKVPPKIKPPVPSGPLKSSVPDLEDFESRLINKPKVEEEEKPAEIRIRNEEAAKPVRKAAVRQEAPRQATPKQSVPKQTAVKHTASKQDEPIRKGIPDKKDNTDQQPIQQPGDPVRPQRPVRKTQSTRPVRKPTQAMQQGSPARTGQAPARKPGQQEQAKQPAPVRQQAPKVKPPGERILYSPVNLQEEPVQISPMERRPVSTQSVVQGPILQLPGQGQGGGPKFVRTVVTTTTTTYEPISEDVIRQITSQTSPIALTGQQPVSGDPVQAVPVRQVPVQTGPLDYSMQEVVAAQTGQYIPRQQVQRQQARPGQGQGARRPVQARPGQQGQRPPMQGQRPGQQSMNRPQGQQPGQQGMNRPQGQQAAQGGSIIGTMEANGPREQTRPRSQMSRQLDEIEKALGLAGDMNTPPPATVPSGPVNNVPNTNGMNGAGGANGEGPQRPNHPAMTDRPLPEVSSMPDPDAEDRKSKEYMMLFVEGIIFILVLCICISIFQKIKKGNKRPETSNEPAYEETDTSQPDAPQDDYGDNGTEEFATEEANAGDELVSDEDQAGELLAPSDGGSSDSVDLDNDDFTLRCTNVTVKLDTDGNPAALIYFSFKNKTGNQLSLTDVFPISVTQNGEPCDTSAAMDEYPEEYYNKDMKISDGSELSCAYAVSLKDAVSPLRLTVNSNYNGFSEVGTTEINIQ